MNSQLVCALVVSNSCLQSSEWDGARHSTWLQVNSRKTETMLFCTEGNCYNKRDLKNKKTEVKNNNKL